MKKQIYKIILPALLFAGCFCGGCTDKFEEVNTNPHKLYDTDFKYIFPGTVYKTLRLFSDLNYNYFLNYSRLVTVQYITAPRETTSDTYYNQAYVEILRDLQSIETEYSGQDGHQNRLAIVKTWKAYIYYMLVSIYGPIPMSNALLDVNESRTSFRYDSEAQVYTQILDLLKEAGELYQPASQYISIDCLSPDYVFDLSGNTILRWQKFTNTFRLNIAMHVQNCLPELARQHAEEVMLNENLLISSNEENVAPHFGTDKTYDVSYYYTRFLENIETTGEWNDYVYPTLSEYFAQYLFSYNDPRIKAFFIESNEGAPSNQPAYLFTDTITRAHICTQAECSDFVESLNNWQYDSQIEPTIVQEGTKGYGTIYLDIVREQFKR